MLGPFRAVFFDLDGTLRIVNPSPTLAFIEVAYSLGVELDGRSQRRVMRWAHHYWGQHEQVKYDMDRFDGDDFWAYYSRLLFKASGVTTNLKERARVVRNWFYHEYDPLVSLAPTGRETIQALKNENLIVGLISNRSDPLQDVVTSLGLDGCFDITLAAGEVGYWKPDPAIFHYVMAQFEELAPQECLHIGDNFYADGHGAAAAGLQPVLFDPEDLYLDGPYPCIRQMDELLMMLDTAWEPAASRVSYSHAHRHPVP